MEYLRTYQTFEVLAFSYGISKSYANKCYHRTLTLLAQEVGLKNPEKITRKQAAKVIVDVSCQPIQAARWRSESVLQRPQKKHIVKSQLIVNQKGTEIFHCHLELQGSQADLSVFKRNRPRISAKIRIGADLAYVGIDQLHPRTKVPVKTPKGGELTKNEKKRNKRFRRKRVKVEHVIRLCKVFRIVKEVYRNKRRRLQTVWSVICGLVNYKYLK